MKSIRLSLIVYFLVLLTGALGAISWFSYQTTAHSLREREIASEELIKNQCKVRVKTLRDDLDRHLLHKAQALANLRLVTAIYPRRRTSRAPPGPANPFATWHGSACIPTNALLRNIS